MPGRCNPRSSRATSTRGRQASCGPMSPSLQAGWLSEDDAYYFSHHEARRFPVFRIQYEDGERFYLDAVTGELAYSVDRERQWLRWVFHALHRGDFSALVQKSADLGPDDVAPDARCHRRRRRRYMDRVPPRAARAAQIRHGAPGIENRRRSPRSGRISRDSERPRNAGCRVTRVDRQFVAPDKSLPHPVTSLRSHRFWPIFA